MITRVNITKCVAVLLTQVRQQLHHLLDHQDLLELPEALDRSAFLELRAAMAFLVHLDLPDQVTNTQAVNCLLNR
jgi:hypothetical protein